MKTTNGKDNRLIEKVRGRSYYDWEAEQERGEVKMGAKVRHARRQFPNSNDGTPHRIAIDDILAENHLKREIFWIIQTQVPSMSITGVREHIEFCRYYLSLGIDGFWGGSAKGYMEIYHRFLGVLMERYEELYDDMFLDAQKNAGENREWRNKDLWDVPKFIQVNAGN